MLAAECGELLERSIGGDVRAIPAGVGDRLAEEDAGWDEPAMPEFCACRARLARLRGEIRDALSWSREGLRRREGTPPAWPNSPTQPPISATWRRHGGL